MKKILLSLICLSSLTSQAQVSIHNGNKLTKNYKIYKMSQYQEVFQNESALNYMKKSRSNKTIGTIISSIGGIGLGFGLGGALFSSSKSTTTYIYVPYGPTYETTHKPSKGNYWAISGMGAVIGLVSIPFYTGAKKNLDKALKVENGESMAEFKPYFDFKSTGTGLAMSYNF